MSRRFVATRVQEFFFELTRSDVEEQLTLDEIAASVPDDEWNVVSQEVKEVSW